MNPEVKVLLSSMEGKKEGERREQGRRERRVGFWREKVKFKEEKRREKRRKPRPEEEKRKIGGMQGGGD